MSQSGITTRPLRHWRIACLWLILACGLPMQAWSSEAALRVAFVYNFLKFIEWPETSGPIKLCALGAENEMRLALDQLSSRRLNNRNIQITHIDNNAQLTESMTSCQLIYWPVSTKQFQLSDSPPKNILLVADEDKSQLPIVGIGLLRNQEGRIEFLINEAVIEQAEFRVSSQLLKLAKNYKSSSQGGDK